MKKQTFMSVGAALALIIIGGLTLLFINAGLFSLSGGKYLIQPNYHTVRHYVDDQPIDWTYTRPVPFKCELADCDPRRGAEYTVTATNQSVNVRSYQYTNSRIHDLNPVEQLSCPDIDLQQYHSLSIAYEYNIFVSSADETFATLTIQDDRAHKQANHAQSQVKGADVMKFDYDPNIDAYLLSSSITEGIVTEVPCIRLLGRATGASGTSSAVAELKYISIAGTLKPQPEPTPPADTIEPSTPTTEQPQNVFTGWITRLIQWLKSLW